MVQEAFRTIGFDWTNPQSHNVAEPNSLRWRLQPFLIPVAAGNEIIPDQGDFVRPYRIKSVIGMGGQLANNEGVMILAFSTVPLTDHDVDKLSEITPYVLTALANYNRPDTLWRKHKSA